jgi:hypothetical protein
MFQALKNIYLRRISLIVVALTGTSALGQRSNVVGNSNTGVGVKPFEVSPAVKDLIKDHLDYILSQSLKKDNLPCAGGGKTWAKLQPLKMNDKQFDREFEARFDKAEPGCKVMPVVGGGDGDPYAVELVIPQRILRSALSQRGKAECLQIWVDWFAADRVLEANGRKIVRDFELRCGLANKEETGGVPASR